MRRRCLGSQEDLHARSRDQELQTQFNDTITGADFGGTYGWPDNGENSAGWDGRASDRHGETDYFHVHRDFLFGSARHCEWVVCEFEFSLLRVVFFRGSAVGLSVTG